MELELKHLAPYLPYGLKWYHKRMDSEPTELLTMTTVQLESDGNVDVMFEEEWISDMVHKITIDGFPTWVKPILRPMSDLTKEIDHNGEKLSPEKILSHLDLEWLITSDNLIMKTNYEDVLKLLEWHFDIFGLITAGLAIDINQTNPSPSH